MADQDDLHAIEGGPLDPNFSGGMGGLESEAPTPQAAPTQAAPTPAAPAHDPTYVARLESIVDNLAKAIPNPNATPREPDPEYVSPDEDPDGFRKWMEHGQQQTEQRVDQAIRQAVAPVQQNQTKMAAWYQFQQEHPGLAEHEELITAAFQNLYPSGELPPDTAEMNRKIAEKVQGWVVSMGGDPQALDAPRGAGTEAVSGPSGATPTQRAPEEPAKPKSFVDQMLQKQENNPFFGGAAS